MLDGTAAPELERGPVKVIVADHYLPSLDELVDSYASARAGDRCLAVHCVTRTALVLALAAWEVVGTRPGDRIEHGAVIPLELAARIAELELTVVTQPGFVAERGDDYLRDVDPGDRADLWRCATLRAAGIPVGGSTDAPFGHPDPWRADLRRNRSPHTGWCRPRDGRASRRDRRPRPVPHPAGTSRRRTAACGRGRGCRSLPPRSLAPRDDARTELSAGASRVARRLGDPRVMRHRRSGVAHLVDQAPLECRDGVDPLRGERQLCRALSPDPRRQAGGATRSGHQAEGQFG